MGQEKKAPEKPAAKVNPDYETYKKELISLFKTKVKIVCDDTGKGKISIPFKNEKEFERIKEILGRIEL